MRHKHFDRRYYGVELLVDFDLPESVDLRGILYNLPLKSLRRLPWDSVGAKRCDTCGDYYLAKVDPACVLKMWRNRLLALASEERPDGRELDAIVAVYAALFGQQVTKLRVDVMRPMRGHFEDHPVHYDGEKARAYFRNFAI